MYPSDTPPGYVETWRKIISVYPPVDAMTLQSALGVGGYPGSPSMYPMNREVRVNAEKGRIEIWERRIEQAQPQRPDGFQAAAQSVDPRGKPGSVHMQSTSGG
jgi:hypothetical protein